MHHILLAIEFYHLVYDQSKYQHWEFAIPICGPFGVRFQGFSIHLNPQNVYFRILHWNCSWWKVVSLISMIA